MHEFLKQRERNVDVKMLNPLPPRVPTRYSPGQLGGYTGRSARNHYHSIQVRAHSRIQKLATSPWEGTIGDTSL